MPGTVPAPAGGMGVGPPRGRLYYALLAMTDMARQPDALPLVLADIARRHDLPQRYLEQVCNRLRRAGLLQAVRGPGGGYRLAGPPEQVSIADIAAAAADQVTDRADIGAAELLLADCPVCRLWGAYQTHNSRFLAAVTLADVVSGDIPGAPARLSTSRPSAA